MEEDLDEQEPKFMTRPLTEDEKEKKLLRTERGRMQKFLIQAIWDRIDANPLFEELMARKRTIRRKGNPADSEESRKCVRAVIQFVRDHEGESEGWVPCAEIVNEFWPKTAHRTAIVRILDELTSTGTLQKDERIVKTKRSKSAKKKMNAFYRLSVLHPRAGTNFTEKLARRYQELSAAKELLKERGCRNPDKAIADRIQQHERVVVSK